LKIFDNYAHYYDLLYEDKNYRAEANYVDQLIKNHRPQASTILDLGCGTGNHDFLLSEMGYKITGVDCSDVNIEIAQKKLTKVNPVQKGLRFIKGDIRKARLNQTFDVILSLFHVMSYQVNNEDLKAAFLTAQSHLKNGGIFIFDCWYGPAVLSVRPEVRIKNAENTAVKLTRIAEPKMLPDDNIVEVDYRLFICNKNSIKMTEIHEKHYLRYLFKPEIEYLLAEHQLKPIRCLEWMTNRSPGFDTWSVCFINRAIN